MNIAIASDHRGIELKSKIKSFLDSMGYIVNDCGPYDDKESVDYPDYGIKVAFAVNKGESDRGVLVCGTGIGMSLVANKVKGVRAALCHDEVTIEMSRKHNNANVLCIGNDIIDQDKIDLLLKLWFTTEFEGGRHQRRVNKIMDLEN